MGNIVCSISFSTVLIPMGSAFAQIPINPKMKEYKAAVSYRFVSLLKFEFLRVI